MNALDHQTGGDHYKGEAIEPIQFAIAHKMPAADFSVFKHIFRHRQKLGAEDVKKAIHYGQIILQEEYGVHLPIFWDDYTSEPNTNTPTNPDANPAFRPGAVVYTDGFCACGRYADHECGGYGSTVKKRDCPFGETETVQSMQGPPC
jgi:hypothetical protein